MTDHLLKKNLNINITELLYARETIKICIKNTSNNINLDEYDKILNEHITTHNKISDVYLVNCEFKTEFDKTFIINLEARYVLNKESGKTKIYLYTVLIV